MHYQVQVSRISGDVVALRLVADAMARAKATAFGATEFHRPAFDGTLPGISASLLNEARKGCFQVCDQNGFAASADELIERAKREGSYSPVSLNEVLSELLCLYATLKHLNDWGASAGNSFSLDPNAPPWIDERGVMGVADDVGPTAENGKRKKVRLLLSRIPGLDPLNMEGEKIDFQALAIASDKDFQVAPSTFSGYLEKTGALPKLCNFVQGRGRNLNFYRDACPKIGVKVADYERALKGLENQNETAKRKKNK